MTSVLSAVLSVFLAYIGVQVVVTGIRMILEAIRGEETGLSSDDRKQMQHDYDEAARLSEESRKRWES